jgi:hypothetical protein
MKKLISVIIPRKKHLKSKKKQKLLKLANFQNPLKPQKLTRRAIINKKWVFLRFYVFHALYVNPRSAKRVF